MKCSLYNPAAFVDLCFLWKPPSGSSPCIATQITSISSSVESRCHLGCCTGTCYSLPGGQVSTSLFVFPTVSLQHPLLCWWARKQQTATPAAQEAPICSASARLLAAATCIKKQQTKKPDDRHLFLFHATADSFFVEDIRGDAARRSVSYLMPLPLSASLTPHLAQWGSCLGRR